MPQHILNEGYKDYKVRKYLERRRDNTNAIFWVIIFAVLLFGGYLLESLGLFENEILFPIFGWIIIIFAVYLGIKFYLKFNIPKRSFTKEEIWENNY